MSDGQAKPQSEADAALQREILLAASSHWLTLLGKWPDQGS